MTGGDEHGGAEMKLWAHEARASITVNDERPARRGAPLPGLIHAATDLTSWSRGFDSSVYAHQRHQLKPRPPSNRGPSPRPTGT